MIKTTKIANAAVIVMASIVLSRLTGFFREMLVPNILGTNQTGDAYNIAFRITGLMYDLLVGGAIAAALIPVLSGYLATKKEEEGWKAISTFMNFVMIGMVFFCALGMLFAPTLVRWMAVGFHDPNQLDLTVRLVRILFPSVAFLMLAGMLNGVLNSYRRFVASAFGPTLYNLGCTLSLFFLGKSQYGVTGVAYGIVLSSFSYFLLQLVFSWKNVMHYKPKLLYRHEGFRKLLSLAVPSLAASSVVQLNVIITGSFASLFNPGSVTAYNVADRTWQMPFGIFAQGIGIAILPSLASMLAKGELENYKSVLEKSIRTVLAIIIPCAVLLIALDQSIVRTLFQFTSRFQDEAVVLTGNILIIFSTAMVSQSLVSILMRAFYAANNTKIPFYSGAASVVVIFVLSFLFYKFTSLEARGMALAYSVASLFNATILLILLNRKICKINLAELMRYILTLSLISAVMGGGLYAFQIYLPVHPVGKLQQLLFLGLNTIFGIGFFTLLAYLFKIEEVIYALQRFIPARFRKTASD